MRTNLYVVESSGEPTYKITPPELLEIPEPTPGVVAEQFEGFFNSPIPPIQQPLVQLPYTFQLKVNDFVRHLYPFDRFRRFLLDPHIRLTQAEYYELVQAQWIANLNSVRLDTSNNLLHRKIWIGTPQTFLEAIKLFGGKPDEFEETVKHEQEHIDALNNASNNLGGDWYGTMVIDLCKPPLSLVPRTANVDVTRQLPRVKGSLLARILYAPRSLVSPETFLKVNMITTQGTLIDGKYEDGTYQDKRDFDAIEKRMRKGINGLALPYSMLNAFANLIV